MSPSITANCGDSAVDSSDGAENPESKPDSTSQVPPQPKPQTEKTSSQSPLTCFNSMQTDQTLTPSMSYSTISDTTDPISIGHRSISVPIPRQWISNDTNSLATSSDSGVISPSDVIFKEVGYGSIVSASTASAREQIDQHERLDLTVDIDSLPRSNSPSDDGHFHGVHCEASKISPNSPFSPVKSPLLMTLMDSTNRSENVFTDVKKFQNQTEKHTFCKPFVLHPPCCTPEPFRDVAGPFKLYRVALIIWTIILIVSLFKLQDLIWPPNPRGSKYANEWYAQKLVGFILLVSFPPSVLSFIGAIWFRFDSTLDSVQPMQHRVVFRIVSRGLNNDCLLGTIRACQTVMRRNSYFPYLVEVVTEAALFEAPDDSDVLHLKVPSEYKTPNGTKFKARALHYACQASLVPNNAWIVHLDEESQPTSSAIKGICKFISNCERTKDRRRIGQGCILYNRSWKSYRFLTLADMRRTGDDFGHFFLQHNLGVILFGLHGSFVVCRADVENKIGFDVGPDGSITEDAWWSLMALERGCRFAWVEGFLAEQSTQSLSDMIRQRRRWNYGLLKVAFMSPARLRYRVSFAFFLLTWFVAPFVMPFQLAYVLTIAEHHLPVPMIVRVPTLFIISIQLWNYLIGWVINVREGLEVKWYMIPLWSIVLIVLYPIFQLIEIVAMMSSFFAGFSKSGRGFHVVQKTALNGSNRNQEEKSLMV